MKRTLLIVILVFITSLLLAQNPGQHWKKYQAPEEAGWSSEKLEIAKKYYDELNFVLDNYYREDVIFPIIDSTANHIQGAYNIDPFLGGAGIKLELEVAKLKALISERIQFYRENLRD